MSRDLESILRETKNSQSPDRVKFSDILTGKTETKRLVFYFEEIKEKLAQELSIDLPEEVLALFDLSGESAAATKVQL